MSDLVPKLADLAAALPARPVGQDAAELFAAVSTVGWWQEVDSALGTVVRGWVTV